MNRFRIAAGNKALSLLLLGLAFLSLAVAAGAVGPGPGPPPGADPAPRPATDGVFAAFAAELERIRTELRLPGMSAAILQDQEIVWAQGFGYAHVEEQVPATADTAYHLASVTKPIAATLLLQLVEEGRLSLDDPVSKYGVRLPEADVTVRHLLTHTSAGTPGAVHDYDGNRYSLLAQVFASACGASFGECLTDRFITPLGMAHTAANPVWGWSGWSGYLASMGWSKPYRNFPRVYRDLAQPYQFDPAYDNVLGAYPLFFSPAAGLLTSVTDLAKFDIALDRDQLVRPQTRAEMFAPALSNSGQPLIYGLGWYTQNYKDTRLIWHSGGWPPSVSALYLKVPDENLTFIVLANNYNLTRPYPFDQGDVLYSTPAIAFYRRFVFPRKSGQSIPAVDWSAGDADLIATLGRITHPDVRAVLEHELWSYRKLYASVGDIDRAERLGDVHRAAFPDFSPSRWDPAVTGTVGPPPEPQPVSLLPAQVSLLSRLLLGWLLATAGALLLLLAHFWRRSDSRSRRQLTWLPIVLLFGVLGWATYLLARGWPHRSKTEGPAAVWRRALEPSLLTASGSMAGLLLALLVISVYFPDVQQGAAPAIAVMLLVNWLLFQAPFAALEGRRAYLVSVRETLRRSVVATFFLLLGAVPAMIYLAEGLFLHVTPDSPLILVVLILAGSAGAVAVYPYNLWSLARGGPRPSPDTIVAPLEGSQP